MKYLLSNNTVTSKVEYYVIDLFKLYLSVYPGDIPGASGIGFDFNLRGTFKANLASEVESRVSSLVSTFQNRFNGSLSFRLEECALVDETRVRIVVSCGRVRSDDIVINLYDEK
jgi:hypothetical protein